MYAYVRVEVESFGPGKRNARLERIAKRKAQEFLRARFWYWRGTEIKATVLCVFPLPSVSSFANTHYCIISSRSPDPLFLVSRFLSSTFIFVRCSPAPSSTLVFLFHAAPGSVAFMNRSPIDVTTLRSMSSVLATAAVRS